MKLAVAVDMYVELLLMQVVVVVVAAAAVPGVAYYM
jgi:hypothetical protein